MESKKIIELIQSDDWKERLKGEFYELEDRIEKLYDMLDKWDKGKLNFTPTSDRKLYNEQLSTMVTLRSILGLRAKEAGNEL